MDEAIATVAQDWVEDPILFFEQVLGMNPEFIWDKMREMTYALRDNRKVAIKAGHSVSKSYTIARLILWFLYCHYPSTIITTAPTHTQVEQILWREIRDAYRTARIKLPGELTKTRLEIEDKWFAFGFSTKPDQGGEGATKMQGFHNEHMLVVFDEANGILRQIWEAKDALLTSEGAKFLAIGNPTTATGPFPDCFKDSSYEKITISVLDTPNYIAGKEIIPGLSGRDFEQDIINKYGKTSNQYKSRVLGVIPDEDADALIPLNWIEKAEERGKVKGFRTMKRFITWDVADGGHDKHVIKAWENKTEIDEIVLYDRKVEEAEPYVWRLLKTIEGNAIVVDADGIGRVAVGLLEQSNREGVEIIPFYGSSKEVRDSDTFKNKRDEGWWACRKDFEENRISISKNAEQREELCNVRLAEHVRGFVAMEKKKDMKARIGRSPDFADPIMMMSAEFDNVPTIGDEEDDYVNNIETKYVYYNDPMAV